MDCIVFENSYKNIYMKFSAVKVELLNSLKFQHGEFTMKKFDNLFVTFFTVLFLVSFLPKQIKADDAKIDAFVQRLYTNILGRDADNSGLEVWRNKFKNEGWTATEVAKFFYDSSEFKALNVSNGDFLDRSYKTFFDRAADPGGKSFWLNEMENSGKKRESIFYNFALSDEFKGVSKSYGIKAYNSKDGIKAFTIRFYNIILDRESDPGGLDYWVKQLQGKNATGADIAKFFFGSKEYTDKNPSNDDFINAVYKTMFDRVADTGGFNYWKGVMDQGASKNDIIDKMAATTEFKSIEKKYLEILDDEVDIDSEEKALNALVTVNEVIGDSDTVEQNLDYESLIDNKINRYISYRQAQEFDKNKECVISGYVKLLGTVETKLQSKNVNLDAIFESCKNTQTNNLNGKITFQGSKTQLEATFSDFRHSVETETINLDKVLNLSVNFTKEKISDSAYIMTINGKIESEKESNTTTKREITYKNLIIKDRYDKNEDLIVMDIDGTVTLKNTPENCADGSYVIETVNSLLIDPQTGLIVGGEIKINSITYTFNTQGMVSVSMESGKLTLPQDSLIIKCKGSIK